MGQQYPAPSELGSRLTVVDCTLASPIGAILGAALQEIIEAELTARIGAESGGGSKATGHPCCKSAFRKD